MDIQLTIVSLSFHVRLSFHVGPVCMDLFEQFELDCYEDINLFLELCLHWFHIDGNSLYVGYSGLCSRLSPTQEIVGITCWTMIF